MSVDLDALKEKVTAAVKLKDRLQNAAQSLEQAQKDGQTFAQQVKQLTRELEDAEKDILALVKGKEIKAQD